MSRHPQCPSCAALGWPHGCSEHDVDPLPGQQGFVRACEGLIDRFYDCYGKHDSWNVPCNGFALDFDFAGCDPHYVGKHRDSS